MKRVPPSVRSKEAIDRLLQARSRRHGPAGSDLRPILMTNDIHLVDPEHPFQQTAELDGPASSLAGLDQFPSGERITFRAARPSVVESTSQWHER
jgi:hypothetical protein